MYRTILFDFDGTVFDTGEGITKSVQYAARAFGFVADDLEALRCFVGPPIREMMAEKFGVDSVTADAMVEKFRERYAAHGINECQPYPGIVALARSLRTEGRNVSIATGKPTVHVNRILKNYGFEDAFEYVIGSELDGTRSQKWEEISVLLGIYGSDGVVMIGDRDNDVRGAKKCGIPCIGVSYGYAAPGELESEGAVLIAKDAEDLRNILKR